MARRTAVLLIVLLAAGRVVLMNAQQPQLTTRDDPRSGREVFTVTDIRLGEPDASLFALPASARVVDLRGVPVTSIR